MRSRKSFYAVLFAVITIAICSVIIVMREQADSQIVAFRPTATTVPILPLELSRGEREFSDWVEQAGRGETRSVSIDSNGVIHLDSTIGLPFGNPQLSDDIGMLDRSRSSPPDIIGPDPPAKALGRASD